MSASAPASDSPIGVLLFNLGGPDDQASVEPFLVNLFSDREIIQLPLGPAFQPFFARLIAKLRGPSVRRNYALIGGGSPQLPTTRGQAAALQRRLNVKGERFQTFVAMRYWTPSTEDALAEMERAGVRRVVTLTLYPQFSRATTGSSQRALDRLLTQPRWKDRFQFTAIDRYPSDPLYLDALAETAREAYEGFAPEVRERVVLLFSAHGLPQRFIDEGDPYVAETEATRAGILERLALPNRQLLGYQSRTGPVKWIGPGTEELLDSLAAEGVGEVLVIPLSFVSDHIETLYEVDMLFGDRARAAGIADYRRSPALNVRPLFIEALARLVETHVEALREEQL
jgi:ferrochelatase